PLLPPPPQAPGGPLLRRSRAGRGGAVLPRGRRGGAALHGDRGGGLRAAGLTAGDIHAPARKTGGRSPPPDFRWEAKPMPKTETRTAGRRGFFKGASAIAAASTVAA